MKGKVNIVASSLYGRYRLFKKIGRNRYESMVRIDPKTGMKYELVYDLLSEAERELEDFLEEDRKELKERLDHFYEYGIEGIDPKPRLSPSKYIIVQEHIIGKRRKVLMIVYDNKLTNLAQISSNIPKWGYERGSFSPEAKLTEYFSVGEHQCKCGKCFSQFLDPYLYEKLDHRSTKSRIPARYQFRLSMFVP